MLRVKSVVIGTAQIAAGCRPKRRCAQTPRSPRTEDVRAFSFKEQTRGLLGKVPRSQSGLKQELGVARLHWRPHVGTLPHARALTRSQLRARTVEQGGQQHTTAAMITQRRYARLFTAHSVLTNPSSDVVERRLTSSCVMQSSRCCRVSKLAKRTHVSDDSGCDSEYAITAPFVASVRAPAVGWLVGILRLDPCDDGRAPQCVRSVGRRQRPSAWRENEHRFAFVCAGKLENCVTASLRHCVSA